MPANWDKLTSKEKILDATLRIIDSSGVQHVTSRKIAALADVNVAAINYHFGSKDNVINEALKAVTSKVMSSFDYLDDLAVSPEIRIKNFLRSYADYALEYPDIFRNFVDQTLHESTAPSEYIEIMKQVGSEKLKALVQEITPTQPPETELTMRIFQMFSSLEFPILVGMQMKNFAHFDYYNQDCRYQYIDLVLKSLLNI